MSDRIGGDIAWAHDDLESNSLALEFLTPRGMTQTELAERIGVSIQRISHFVRRKRSMTPDMALRVVKIR